MLENKQRGSGGLAISQECSWSGFSPAHVKWPVLLPAPRFTELTSSCCCHRIQKAPVVWLTLVAASDPVCHNAHRGDVESLPVSVQWSAEASCPDPPIRLQHPLPPHPGPPTHIHSTGAAPNLLLSPCCQEHVPGKARGKVGSWGREEWGASHQEEEYRLWWAVQPTCRSFPQRHWFDSFSSWWYPWAEPVDKDRPFSNNHLTTKHGTEAFCFSAGKGTTEPT